MKRAICRMASIILAFVVLFSGIGGLELQAYPTMASVSYGSPVTVIRTVFYAAEYITVSVKAIESGIEAIRAGKSFAEVCDEIICEFLDSNNANLSYGDNSGQYFKLLTNEICLINKKIDDLDYSLKQINQTLTDINDTIIAEGYKEYINDFRFANYNAISAVVEEYAQLLISLERSNLQMSDMKLGYDDLYVDAKDLNDMLIGYISGNYREDGMSILDLIYKYVDATDSKEVDSKCVQFAEEIFSAYAFSHYCLLLCRMYQLDYCNQKNINEYVTQNRAPEAFPIESITAFFEKMGADYENTTTKVASYITAHGYNSIDMVHISESDVEEIRVSNKYINSRVYKGDVYRLETVFPQKDMYMFCDDGLYFESSNNTLASIDENGEIIVNGETGSFSVYLKYRENLVASFDFTLEDNDFTEGFGTLDKPFLISSKEELIMALSPQYCSRGYSFKLISDINMENEKYANALCVQNFLGTFDGNGHAVSNMIIDENLQTQNYNFGFFSSIASSSVIKNLTLKNIRINASTRGISSTYCVGIMAGMNNGVIYNCVVENSRFEASKINTHGYYTSYAGGIVGYNNGKIENCYSQNFNYLVRDAKISNIYSQTYRIYVGGLVGYSNGILKNNLVTRPNLSSYYVFEDSYKSNAPSPKFYICQGYAVGNKNTDIFEAVKYDGIMSCYSQMRLYILSSGTTYSTGYTNYYCPEYSEIKQDELENYRITMLGSTPMINRDVYEVVELVGVLEKTKYVLGERLNLLGINLEMKYSSGMISVIPITNVEGFDPYRSGVQTVTVSHEAENGEIFSQSFEVSVECLHSWDSGIITIVPTWEFDGEKTFTCHTCKETKTESIPKLFTDIDSDGDVDQADAELLLQYITGWDVTVNEDVVDVNGDGEVNIRDAALILIYLEENAD